MHGVLKLHLESVSDGSETSFRRSRRLLVSHPRCPPYPLHPNVLTSNLPHPDPHRPFPQRGHRQRSALPMVKARPTYSLITLPMSLLNPLLHPPILPPGLPSLTLQTKLFKTASSGVSPGTASLLVRNVTPHRILSIPVLLKHATLIATT